MRIRMIQQINGTRTLTDDKGENPRDEPLPGKGGEITVSDAEGAALCAAGIAEPVAKSATEKRETR